MNVTCKGLLFSTLFGAGVACAQLSKPFGHLPQPELEPGDKGITQDASFYVCPDAEECEVTVTVAKSTKPGTKCDFTLTGDDGQPFFFIDRNKDRDSQTIAWKLVAADARWKAEFATPTRKKEGINFTEGGDSDHVENPTSATADEQKRKVKANKNKKTTRRSLLLYDIDVALKKLDGSEEPLDCSYGPGIINRGT